MRRKGSGKGFELIFSWPLPLQNMKSLERSLWKLAKKSILFLAFAASHQKEYDVWVKEIVEEGKKRAAAREPSLPKTNSTPRKKSNGLE